MNVSPGNAPDYSPYQKFWEVEISAYLGGGDSGCGHFSNGADGVFRDPSFDIICSTHMGAPMPLMSAAASETFRVSTGPVGVSGGMPFSTLPNPICDVVCVSSEPEVGGVDAWRVVASVEDVHPIWDSRSEKGPGYSVRLRHPQVFTGKNAVSVFIDYCRPNPTAGPSSDLCQETLDSTFHIVNCNPGGI